MRIGTVSGLLLAVYVVGVGFWILSFRSDPPSTARTATRKSRQVIAIGGILIGAFNLYILLSSE